jgi:hypothetical protein
MRLYRFKIVVNCFTIDDCSYSIHRKFLFLKWRRLNGFAFSEACAESWLKKELEKNIIQNIQTWTGKVN